MPHMSRFIPACAGNSNAANDSRERSAVHPRVCGELVVPTPAAGEKAGSSPRVRGTPTRHRPPEANRRFIPACAGNSPPRSSMSRRTTVHPRVCGELQRVSTRAKRRPRFIPACAGNSFNCRVTGRLHTGSSPRVRGTRRRGGGPCRGSPVHPRVCGELRAASLLKWPTNGSSPRVRGTRPRAGRKHCEVRFIPACAGNSAR